MPLLPGKRNIGSNIHEMQAAGHPHDQAVAAALDIARKARADGGMLGDAEPSQPPMEQRPLTPQGLYSGAAEAARNLKQARGTPQQMLSALRSSPGVKPEELKWANVDNAFADRSVISRDELAQHLDRRLPALEEQRHSKFGQYSTPGGTNYRETLLKYQPSHESYADPGSPAAPLLGAPYVGAHWGSPNIVLHRRMSDRLDIPRVSVPQPNTTFRPSYKNDERGEQPEVVPAWRTLTPGLTAHKAIDDKKGTITLSHEPSGLAVKRGLTYWAAQRLAGELGSHTDWNQPGDVIHQFYKDPANKELNEKRVDAFVESASPSNLQYGMPDQELLDRLAALGGKRRVIKEGAKKHLLLDELQSDWAQEGRKRGFTDSAKPRDAEQEHQDVIHGRYQAPAVPAGPWVTNTERWTDLGLKTALYEAAKNGHDTLTWAPGDAHAKRYPELNQIADRVLYHPESKTFAAFKNNRTLLSKTAEPHELGQIIGDAAAKQLLETAPNQAGHHDLNTKDVQVGPRAQGMRGYYDDIVPKRLLKIAREHDKEASITTLKSKDKHINGYPSLPITPKMRESILKRGFPAFKSGGAVDRESNPAPTENPKRLLFKGPGSGGVKGIIVPRHMWEGTENAAGMREINEARAKVYGADKRTPLTVGQVAAIHHETLKQHFSQPLEQQLAEEQEALMRLRAAKHIAPKANTLDESEKLDTVKHEKDAKGRTYEPYASKGVAGHALYTSGAGGDQQFHILNTCPGQTTGCSGGVDANGIVDTRRGTCFAPKAEAQYVNASVRRAAHEQAKFDPAMTKDWILAHTGSLRYAALAADKKNAVTLFRPNVVDESDRSSRYAVQGLNKQRQAMGLPNIIGNSYSKAGELHDPENGWFVTHSNVGPKTKQGASIRDNIARDSKRVRETITATGKGGEDLVNEQGHPTPPMGSYMVTDVRRGSPLQQQMERAFKVAKYWASGRDQSQLTPEERAEGPEAHYDAAGNKVIPELAHHGHITMNGRRYDYQKQHILHPRLVQVGANEDGSPHMIPTDSRFKDTEYLPKNRFMTKNGKQPGPILMTTPTMSTSSTEHQSSFTHHVDASHIAKARLNKGVHEIDPPAEQEASRGKEYIAPQPVKTGFKFATGGAVESGDEPDTSFPEQSFEAQRHLAHRDNEDVTAYHGTPHTFDPQPGAPLGKFNLSRIGTGEGAQAFGHGIYVAEHPDTAKTYMPRDFEQEQKMMKLYERANRANNYPEAEVWEQALLHKTPQELNSQFTSSEYSPEHAGAVKRVTKWMRQNESRTGSLYKVAIPKKHVEKMIGYDEPLKNQQHVINAVRAHIPGYMAAGLPNSTLKASDAYYALSNHLGSDAAASEAFRKAGIPGLRYLDQGSRDGGKGTRNFVLFDPDIATIVDRSKATGGSVNHDGDCVYGFVTDAIMRPRRAEGGGVETPETPSVPNPKFHVGPIHSSVSGRTDHLPITVQSGSYVLPADIVSAGGEGNTLAGFRVLRRTFGGTPYGQGAGPYGQNRGVYGLPVTYADGGKVRAAGVMFVSPDKEVLLMRRSGKKHRGEWAFPAGHIEKGETPEQAARRETREEAGYDHDGGLSPFMHTDREGVDFTGYVAHSQRFTPKLNEEHDGAMWVKPEQAKRDLPLHPGVADAFDRFAGRAAKAHGGESSGVPIVAAGGEHVLSPEQVRRLGHGDIDLGHRLLDSFVKEVRKELIGTLSKLPGPRRD